MAFCTRPILIRGFGITSERVRKIFIFAGSFIFLIVLLGHSWYGPDIWYHLAWGRDLLLNSRFVPTLHTLLPQPIFANMYWLFQVTVYSLYDLTGPVGVSLMFMLLWLAISVLWLGLTRAWIHPALGGLLFLAFVCCVQMRFEQRPEVLSYLFLSLFLLIFSRADFSRSQKTWFYLSLFLLQVLWTNMHGYFVMGPATCGALLVATIYEQPKASWLIYRRIVCVLLLLILATGVSPFGFEVWTAVRAYARLGQALKDLNQELMPLKFWPLFWPLPWVLALWVPTMLWSAWSLMRRQSTFAALLGLVGGLLLLQATRNVPLFLILAAPALAELNSAFAKHIRGWKPSRIRHALVYLPSLLALFAVPTVASNLFYRQTQSLASFGIHLEPASYPVGAVKFLQHIGFQGRLFNDSYDGGYLEFYLPGVELTGDSYFADADVTREYFAAIKDPQALQTLDQRFHFVGLLINVENMAVIDWLWRNPEWTLSYADSHRLLYLRKDNFPQVRLDLNATTFYENEDLRHWVYAFGVTSWAGMALKYQEPGLAKKVLHDLAPAPAIPSTVLRYAIGLAVQTHDRELFELALGLMPKTYEAVPGDFAKIEELRRSGP